MSVQKLDVAIIGAGPYGLSLGAHLQASAVQYRVFGDPMHTWRTSMPQGMHLKSDGFASNLSDPKDLFTLAKYCSESGAPYADIGRPVAVETFIDYGLAFQERYVNEFDQRWISSVRRLPEAFALTLDDGSEIIAQKVVVAVGITNFARMPEVLRQLPAELCTHSSAHVELEKFSGRHVAVVGGGSSALDLAGLLWREGAKVELIVRKDAVSFHTAMRVPRRLHEKILAPTSGLGPGWRSCFYTDAAPLFHHLPEQHRIKVVKSTFGPAAGWFTRDEVVGKVPMILNSTLIGTELEGDRVRLKLHRSNGVEDERAYDHVIAATGYQPDLNRIKIFEPDMTDQISKAAGTPVLSSHFESSIAGLYFIGPIAANSFGPMMRFAYGSRFVARRLAPQLVTAYRT